MFAYFDLGNVLLNFDHDLMCRQMADVVQAAGGQSTAAQVKKILFQDNDGQPALEWRLERGEISTDEFYQEFCARVGAKPDKDQLAAAAYDIFTTNYSIRPVLGALLASNHKLGILSNTNALHWDFIATGRDDLLIPADFHIRALSFEIGSMKPEPEIFVKAAELAGVPRQEIFYVDDIAGHVQAARDVGFDAVQYTTTAQLAKDLRQRGFGFNY